MSWEVFVFKCATPVAAIEELDDDMLQDMGTWTDFVKLVEAAFPGMTHEEGICCIKGENWSIEFYTGEPDAHVLNIIFALYGKDAIYPLIQLCRNNGWQAYDMSSGSALDLDDPATNGFDKFQEYLATVKSPKK